MEAADEPASRPTDERSARNEGGAVTNVPTGVIDLAGSATERAQAQVAAAGEERAAAVREAMRGRLREAAALLERTDAQEYLRQMRALLAARDPAAHLETAGLAAGYGLSYAELFAALHLAVVADHCAMHAARGEGCTAWAAMAAQDGAILAKNRDYGGRWPLPPAVFRMSDPAWGSRTILCVGSYGAPGAYSSGINDDGLALADTQIGSLDHGVGLLRYFVMNDLLVHCADVDSALARVRAIAHCGGGSLVLCDRNGAMAAIELGHSTLAVDRGNGRWVARTNHFVADRLRDRTADDAPSVRGSHARLETATRWLDGTVPDETAARVGMAGHDGPAGTGLCRHGDAPEARTLSCAIYRPDARTLILADGPPCVAPWVRHPLDPENRAALSGSADAFAARN
jgi:predicted choloylglycine hydrolase